MSQISANGRMPLEIVIISQDAELCATLRTAAAASRHDCCVIASHISQNSALETRANSVIVVDINASSHADLVSLQGFMARLGGRAPVIVVTPSFDEAVARWFLQIRVADFHRKPVTAKDVVRSCEKALRGDAEALGDSKIVSFVAAAGGVGATTLAIETAMIFAEAGKKANLEVCLVDLDFEQGACAAYLDLEPRLDFSEILPHPERLDAQLFEVMLARHASGISLLATPQRPAQHCRVASEIVMHLLELCAARFATVIIDLPRHWRNWSDSVVAGSNKTFVVTDMTVPGLRAGRKIVDVINRRLGEQIHAPSQVIVNRFEQTLLFGSGLRRADIDRVLDGVLAGTVSNNYKLVREAIDRGVPLGELKPANPVSADLRRIVQPLFDEANALKVA